MTFVDCVNECLKDRAFLAEYDRLHNTRFTNLKGLEALIDEATGKLEQDFAELFDFIRDYIWLPCIQDEHHPN